MIIYKAQNLKNRKIYIGKSDKTLNERKQRHYKNVRRGGKTNFYNALRKYDKQDFEWSIIEETFDNMRETYWIKHYDSFKNGYNMTEGGTGGDTISMKSTEEKKRQGAKKGNTPWNKGISYTEQQKIDWGYYDRLPRRTFTEKQKREHSVSIKNSNKYQEGLKKRKHGMSKPVVEILEGKVINGWETIKDLANELGLYNGKVRRYIYANKIIDGRFFTWKDVAVNQE